jgi:hypothetical protein
MTSKVGGQAVPRVFRAPGGPVRPCAVLPSVGCSSVFGRRPDSGGSGLCCQTTELSTDGANSKVKSRKGRSSTASFASGGDKLGAFRNSVVGALERVVISPL